MALTVFTWTDKTYAPFCCRPAVQQHHDLIPHNVVVRKRMFDLAEEDVGLLLTTRFVSGSPRTNFASQNADIQAIMSRKGNFITDHLEKDYDAIVEGFRIGWVQS